uniref:DUF834 domain-containing protein n=1 Tax=Setaria viridis TaxID=4556 RepID=A0A4U6WAR8_SETVI|nr:hypothetical protein SEVIR_1G144433v2 [Setaria viridis]
MRRAAAVMGRGGRRFGGAGSWTAALHGVAAGGAVGGASGGRGRRRAGGRSMAAARFSVGGKDEALWLRTKRGGPDASPAGRSYLGGGRSGCRRRCAHRDMAAGVGNGRCARGVLPPPFLKRRNIGPS